MHQNSIRDRLNNPKIPAVEKSIRDCFINWLKNIKIREGATALSISTGYGFWDYLAFKNNKKITKIIATDIVENPIGEDNARLLRTVGEWNFKKVLAEKPLPFSDEYFDLVFHLDVVEHVKKQFLFFSEQYRVLKKNGVLIFGTPNLLRPANLLKLLFGKLSFPIKIGYTIEQGDSFHIQEFYEQQLKILLQEVGFKNINVQYCFFGIHLLNITIAKYPKSKIGKGMCHYLLFKCSK